MPPRISKGFYPTRIYEPLLEGFLSTDDIVLSVGGIEVLHAATTAGRETLKGLKGIREGSLSLEKVIKYLPHFKSAIQVPIYVMGIDL